MALAAGVSTATVSRVLTGSRPVRDDAAAAVLAAVEQLNYRPSQLGRALRKQSSEAIGMILPRVDNPFFATVVQASEQYLRDKGYALLLATSDYDPSVEGQRVEMLVDRHVDGLLISPCHRARSAAAIEDATRRVPVIEIAGATDNFPGDLVAVDDEDGIRQMVAHLRETGRRNLAFVGSDMTNWSGARRSSAFAVLEPTAKSKRQVRLGQFSEDWGHEAGRALLSSRHRPDAIVCGNDLIAIGVAAAAEELGMNIPGDVAIGGYDDIELARLSRPSLTTVRQPITELAHRAVDLLFARLGDRLRPLTRILLPNELIVRASTQPLSTAELDYDEETDDGSDTSLCQVTASRSAFGQSETSGVTNLGSRPGLPSTLATPCAS